MAVVQFLKSWMAKKHGAKSPYTDWLQHEINAARNAGDAAALNISLAHRNGFVREEAVRKAAKVLWPDTMPLLLERVNDWVPQVAAAAENAVLAFRDADDFSTLARCLPQLDALRQCRRRDHAAFVQGIEDWVAAHPKFLPLAATLQIAVPKISRRLFALASAHNTLPASELIRLGLQSRDVMTAKLASQRITQLPENERAGFIQSALSAKAGWLRLAALRLLPAEEGALKASDYLLDPYTTCREWCEKRCGLSEDELKAFRRAALENPQTSSARRLVALRLGGRDALAAPLLVSYLDDPRPAYRAAALLSLARLSPADYESRLKAALTSPVNALARAAAQGMRELNIAVTMPEWHSYAFTVMTEAGARRLLSLARFKNKWDHLGFILELYPHPLFKPVAGRALVEWVRGFNRAGTSMNDAQRRWIAAVRPKYDGAFVKNDSLDFYIK